jgi:hydroxyethylthiazole kinase-like sugar kinase family protein
MEEHHYIFKVFLALAKELYQPIIISPLSVGYLPPRRHLTPELLVAVAAQARK